MMWKPSVSLMAFSNWERRRSLPLYLGGEGAAAVGSLHELALESLATEHHYRGWYVLSRSTD